MWRFFTKARGPAVSRGFHHFTFSRSLQTRAAELCAEARGKKRFCVIWILFLPISFHSAWLLKVVQKALTASAALFLYSGKKDAGVSINIKQGKERKPPERSQTRAKSNSLSCR